MSNHDVDGQHPFKCKGPLTYVDPSRDQEVPLFTRSIYTGRRRRQRFLCLCNKILGFTDSGVNIVLVGIRNLLSNSSRTTDTRVETVTDPLPDRGSRTQRRRHSGRDRDGPTPHDPGVTESKV